MNILRKRIANPLMMVDTKADVDYTTNHYTLLQYLQT